MKAFAVVLLFGTFVFGQDSSSSTNTAPGCGATSVKFDVKTDKSPPPLLQPPPGQAMVYFVEDDTEFESTRKISMLRALTARALGWTALGWEPITAIRIFRLQSLRACITCARAGSR